MMLSINEFIKMHLSQDCLSMVGYIQSNHLIPQISKYFSQEKDFDPKCILTLRIRLFSYYSSLRKFDICDYLKAEINNQLKEWPFGSESPFQNDLIKAEYYINLAYQYRNYNPIIKPQSGEKYFAKSEGCFLRGEEILLNYLKRVDITQTEKQLYSILLFNSMISRFWLYINYSNKPDKAKELFNKLEKLTNDYTITVSAYFLAYYYFVGCYHFNNKSYEKSCDVLIRAEKLICSDETKWFFHRLNKPIKDKLDEAESHLMLSNLRLSPRLLFAYPKIPDKTRGLTYPCDNYSRSPTLDSISPPLKAYDSFNN